MKYIRAPRVFLFASVLAGCVLLTSTLSASADEPAAAPDPAAAASDVSFASSAVKKTVTDEYSADPRGLALFAGEKIRFNVSWSGIPVARSTFSVAPDEAGTFRMKAHTKTRSIVRLIYPVDATITSIVRNPGFSVLYYAKTGKEGWGKNPQREVHFDHQKGQSSYIRNGKLRKNLEIPANVLDPLSVLYYFRTLENIGDREVAVTVCDGKRTITGTVKPVGRETLKTPAGTFDTIIVEPVMEGIGGVFKKSPGATLLVWLTDDELKRPVKVKSEVSVGSFIALAVEIEGPGSPAPALK